MPRQPEVPFEWDKKGQKFSTISTTDPESGVVTRWEKVIKNPVISTISRIDQFPNNGPMRHMTTFESSERLFPTSTRYDITQEEPDYTRHVELTWVGSIRLSVVVRDRSTGFRMLQLEYDDESLRRIYFSHTTIGDPNDSVMAMDLQDRLDYFDERPLEENIRELAELFKSRGENALWVTAELDETDLTETNEFERDQIKKALNKFSPEMQEHALMGGTMITNWGLEAYASDLLTQDERALIIEALAPQVAEQMVDNLELLRMPQARETFAIDSLNGVVATLIACYYGKVKSTSALRTQFERDDNDPRTWSITIGSDEAPMVSDRVELGTEYRFDERGYTLDDIDGKLQLRIRSILRGKGDVFTFPLRVSSDIRDVITTEENSGWEKALEQAPVRLF